MAEELFVVTQQMDREQTLYALEAALKVEKAQETIDMQVVDLRGLGAKNLKVDAFLNPEDFSVHFNLCGKYRVHMTLELFEVMKKAQCQGSESIIGIPVVDDVGERDLNER